MSKVKTYNSYNDYDVYTRSLQYSNPFYDINDKVKPNQNIVQMATRALDNSYLPIDNSRSAWDRFSDALSVGQYTTMGALRGAIDPNQSAIEGLINGFKAANPFGGGFNKGEAGFSDVLETAGWKPESTLGKIAKGTIGFLGDVFLDPLTYVGGGASSLIKGTGKAGLELTHAGSKLSTVMTKDIAEDIIKKQADVRKISITAEDVSSDAEKLMKKYNKVVGVNRAGSDVTLSLANAPFGEKIFGKYADKSIKLADAEKVQALGEKSIAPYYAKIRDSIYGSKLGEMFAPSTALYRASKEDPGKVYDFLKFTEYTRGLKGDQMAVEKLVRDKAKAMNFTPAESKQILELMQDKSIWGKVTQTVKFLDTKEAEMYKNKMIDEKLKIKSELDDLVDTKNSVEAMKFANDNKLHDLTDAYDALKNEHTQNLINLDTTKFTKSEDIKKLLDMYQSELDDLSKKAPEVAVDNVVNNVNNINPDDVVKSYDEFKVALKTRDADIQALKSKGLSALDPSVVENVKKLDKPSVVKQISKYLYGDDSMISPSTWDTHLDEVVSMIKDGYDKSSILAHINKNSKFYNGKAQLIYPFIAKELGYGSGTKFANWEEMYKNPVEELYKRMDDMGKLSPEDEKSLLGLQQLKLKRDYWLAKFNGMKSENIRNFLTERANQELEATYDEVKHLANTTGRTAPRYEEAKQSKMFDDSYASDKMKYAEFIDKEQVNKNSLHDYIVEKIFAKSDILDKPGTQLSDAYVKWTNQITDEADNLMKYVFNKTNIESLSPKQKEALYSMAVYNANAKSSGKKLTAGIDEALARKITKEAEKRSTILKWDGIKNTVKEGVEIEATKGNSTVRGVVSKVETDEFGLPNYTIKLQDGQEVGGITPKKVTDVVLNNKKATVEELVSNSEITADSVNRVDELNTMIDEQKSALKSLDDEYNTSYHTAINDFKTSSEDFTSKIRDIEETQKHLNDALNSGDVTKIDDLTKRHKEIDDALNSDDAFETFMRGWIGDKSVDDAIKKTNPKIGQIVLDTKTDVTDKVKDIVKVLRGEMIQVAQEEVNIGKLKSEQADGLLMEYLPHILTDEGRKLFTNNDEIRKIIPNFGDDLGYGRKFNPYAMSRQIHNLPDGNGGFIKNPTIEQINEFFKPMVQGKNVMSESIADIYLARAMKHTELMYDWQYMHTMMDKFGKTIAKGELPKEGYKAVINYGELKEFVRENASKIANNEIDAIKISGGNVAEGDFKQAFEKHINNTLDGMGLNPKVLDEISTPMVELSNEQITKIQQIRPDLIKEVNDVIVQKANQSRKLQMMKDNSRFLQLYDKFTHLIKLNQTTVLPSFHIRNKMSNTFNNWLNIGADAFNPEFQKKTFLAMKNDGKIEGALKIVKLDGSIDAMSWNDVYDVAKKYGVIDDGYFAKDIGVGMATDKNPVADVFSKLGLKPKYNPGDTKNFTLYKKGAEIGGMIEGQDRLLHFASELSRGKTFEEASDSVNKFLFDYSDITAFEANVMKRIIPYYTWLRKNAALQLNMMLEQPKKFLYVSKVVGGIDSMVNDEDRINKAFVNDFATDWVQTPFHVTNQEGRQEPVLWNPNLPYMDVSRIPNPLHPIDSLKSLFTQTNPLIKTPIEQMMNRNVFFEQPIAKEGDNELAKRADHIASQFALYNTGSDLAMKSGADFGLEALNALTGLKLLSYDYDKYKAMKIKELSDKNKKKK